MVGVLQNHARSSSIPLDRIAFKVSPLRMNVSVISAPPSVGVYIYGLAIVGARWSREAEVLVDEAPVTGGSAARANTGTGVRAQGNNGFNGFNGYGSSGYATNRCPVLHFKPDLLSDDLAGAGMDGAADAAAHLDGDYDGHVYNAPMYHTAIAPHPSRCGVVSTAGISSSLVTCVDLPASKHPSHWVLRGCALVSDLSELAESTAF
jgi:hypothetical protein